MSIALVSVTVSDRPLLYVTVTVILSNVSLSAVDNPSTVAFNVAIALFYEVYKYINERIITTMDRDILREEIQLYNVSTEREINSNSTERIRDICNCLYYPSVIVDIFPKE